MSVTNGRDAVAKEGHGVMPTLSIYFPIDFPDKTLAGHTHRLTVPRPDSDTSEYVLGRAADLALTLAVKNISRHHCAVSYSYAADRWAIQDLQSMGGTWLNGQRLAPYDWAPLAIGDRLRLSSNPPISVVEDEHDTISGDFEAIDDDDGPATVASVNPIAVAPAPPPPPAADGNLYDDAALMTVKWFVSGSTFWGKVARFVLVVLLVAAATIIIALVVIH